MEMVWVLLAGGLLSMLSSIFGFLVGREIISLHRTIKKLEAPPAPRPICECKHHRGTHKDGTGRCMAIVAYGPYSMHREQCPCHIYTGPEPLTMFWTPPVLLQDEEQPSKMT